MRRYTSPAHAHRFLERFGPIREHFCPGRHRRSGSDHRTILATRFAIWPDVTGMAADGGAEPSQEGCRLEPFFLTRGLLT